MDNIFQDNAFDNDEIFEKLLVGGKVRCSETKWREKDPVARLRAIKAYSNHHYIITEFLHQSGSELTEESRQLDPMRKTLILARYCEFLSVFYVQYSREYLEISKVGEGKKSQNLSLFKTKYINISEP